MLMNALQASGGSVPSGVGVGLSNLIGSDNAAVIQYILMILVYGSTMFLVGGQLLRIQHCGHDRNHEKIQIREEARERIRSGVIIIVVVILIGAIGMSAVFFFLNKFMGV